MGEFLEEIGLGDHVASFIEKRISGDMLLGDTDETDEMLEELGVESATEKLKIKVFMGGLVCCDIASKGVQMAYGIWGHAPILPPERCFSDNTLRCSDSSVALLGPYCH